MPGGTGTKAERGRMANNHFESHRQTHERLKSKIRRPSPKTDGKKRYWDEDLRCWFYWRPGVNPAKGLESFKYYHSQYNERGNK